MMRQAQYTLISITSFAIRVGPYLELDVIELLRRYNLNDLEIFKAAELLFIMQASSSMRPSTTLQRSLTKVDWYLYVSGVEVRIDL